MLDTLHMRLAHAARRLLRAPSFTVATALTLALGIGGTVAVFTVVDGVLFRPLPYANASQLVDLSHTLDVHGIMHVDQSDATYLVYRRDNHAFTDMGAYRASAVNLRVTDGADAERVTAGVVSASVFSVLRTPPLRGRWLTADDDAPAAPDVALIGEGLWQRDFGGDPAIIGRRIAIDGVDHQVVGIMPVSFHFPAADAALWLPMRLDPARTKSAAFDYRGIARLRPGISIDAAQAELDRLLPTVPVVFPGRLSPASITATHMQAVVRPLRDVIVGDVARVLWITFGAVLALLLVACANVASLFLARAEGRRRELAVRRALGASRAAVLGEFISEAALLATLGGALGLGLATVGVSILQSSGDAVAIPRLDELHVDARVVAVTIAVTTLTALLVSALPMMRSSSTSLASVLASHSPSASGGQMRQRARRALVMAQVALALMLLAGAGLFARSFARLLAVQPGFDAQHALAFRVDLPDAAYPAARDVAQAAQQTLAALRALPGVEAAGITTKLPLDAEARQDSAVFVEDHPLEPGQIPAIDGMAFVSPDYFRAMGIPIVAGRTLAPLDPSADPSLRPREVVVSEAFANRYWSTLTAVGRRIRMTPADPWATIVGVAGAVRDAGLEQPVSDEVYIPVLTTTVTGAPWAPRNLAFVLRTRGDVDALVPSIRDAVRRAMPGVPVYRVTPLRSLARRAAARTTFTLFLLGVAALVATAVGATGIFGVIAYLVSLRRREIGVRLALGASPAGVRALMVRHAMTDAAAGIVMGLVGVLALSHLLASALFGVGATDPLALGGSAAVLLVTAFAASWLPASSAAAVDPATALRSE